MILKFNKKKINSTQFVRFFFYFKFSCYFSTRNLKNYNGKIENEVIHRRTISIQCTSLIRARNVGLLL